ncbi:hypothetical protein R1flu_007041 [Riccia fluitans]|uniref:Uncharacterized protein n=1 Tax=Riccia fluitans TaxID=41844 RepID=A0ABD1Z0R9_9MARC
MAFGLFGGSDSGKKGDGGGSSVKRSDSGKKEDSVKSVGDGGSESSKKGEDTRCINAGVRDEGSGSHSRRHSALVSLVKDEETESSEHGSSSHSGHSSHHGESSSVVVSEARKIQVKEAELEQAKLSAKDVHRRQEHVYGNFWSVSPVRWATITGNIYALNMFRLQNSIPEAEEELQDFHFLDLLNTVNEDGMNCLHVVANRGQCIELTHLLQHREIFCKNLTSMKEKIRHTAKLKSLQSLQREIDMEEVLSFLVSIPGIDLNSRDKKENTPLLLASACGHLKAVEILLDASAAMDLMNEDGLNCLHIAASAGHSAVVDRIVQEAGLLDMELLNVKSGADNEWTALHYAVGNSRLHTLELLLNYPNIEVDVQDHEGCTPLILACSIGYVPAVSILLRKGASKSIKNHAMLNSSHVAAVGGHVDVLKELTEYSNKPQQVAVSVPIPAAAPYTSEEIDGSDEEVPFSEVEETVGIDSADSLDFTDASAASPQSEVEEDEVKYHRTQTSHEYRRSDQILRNQAEINTRGNEMQSAVSLAVS